jgi:hypothetical protein
MNNMKKLSLAILGLMLASVVAIAADSTIEERIKPVGSTCMAGEDCAAAAVAVAADAGSARSGEDVYKNVLYAMPRVLLVRLSWVIKPLGHRV